MWFTAEDYCELLGLYLGDGCISETARTTRLRITLDLKYPRIISDARALIARCFPHNRVDIVPRPDANCINVSVYSLHLPCLFPQHGLGRKNEREIALEPWQWGLVASAPWQLLRGLIRSDGSVFINRTGPYEYLSYDFTNYSADVIAIFRAACYLVCVAYRVTQYQRAWKVRINRRPSVGLMLGNVGIKE